MLQNAREANNKVDMKFQAKYLTHIGAKAEEIDWQEVYELHLKRVFHFFCYKVGSTDLAEDLTAITFEKAWRGRKNFRKERGQISAWLMGIARNVSADHFRQRHAEEPLTENLEQLTRGSLEEEIQTNLDFQSILALLAQCSVRERELVAMKYGAELTNREIARLTGLSETNVGSILYRVVNKLRTEWEKTHER